MHGRPFDVKRIGDILIANGWIESSILQRAVANQAGSGLRLCSLLVLSGALGADEAACALGEQHGVAAALQRHLTRRDRSLAELLSPALARACVALPIGRMGNGDVIVCVRDPSTALEVQLGRAMKQKIRLAVAPAHQLEELVLETYGPEEANEFDVDLSTGPILSLDLEDDDQVEPLSEHSLSDLGALELVDLDDTGVSKDMAQNQIPIGNQRTTTLPPTNIAVDAPTFRPGTAQVVDAPSYRSSTAIVVDAPSQREPPGRAALAAAGIAVSRTQTPRSSNDATREAVDAERIAIARTQTPREHAPPGRAALAAAGPALPRTTTPPPGRSADEPAVPRNEGLAISRTRTPVRSSLASAATHPVESVSAAEAEFVAAAIRDLADLELGPSTETEAEQMGAAAEAKVAEREPAAADATTRAKAAAEATARAEEEAQAAADAAAATDPAPFTAPSVSRVPTPLERPGSSRTTTSSLPTSVRPPAASNTPPAGTRITSPAIPASPSTPPPASSSRDSAPALPLPSNAPPRADGQRPAPAAMAALQRASANVARTATPRESPTVPSIPPRPIPAMPSRPTPVPAAIAATPAIATGTLLPASKLAVSDRLGDALAALNKAPTIDAACDAMMAFVKQRWSAALLLDVERMSATGRRGHGAQVSDDLAQWIVMSLDEPSLLQVAFAFNDVATASPGGHSDVENRLQRLLGLARTASAISITVDGKPTMLLAVGDPNGDDVKTATADLERLALGASAAFTRLSGR